MIEFKFKLNKETISATVPEGWHEVKLKHILALEENGANDASSLLSALTGINYEFIENSKNSTQWSIVIQLLTFIYEAPNWKKIRLPKKVTVNGKLITPPRKIEVETFGQSRLFANAFRSVDTDKTIPINILPELIAIYLQPAYDGLFEAQRIDDIKKYVLEMKAFEAMPYAFFFSKKWQRLNIFGKLGLRASLKTMKNLKSILRQVAIN